ALNADGSIATNYVGTVHITGSDLQAGLSSDTLQPVDNARHALGAIREAPVVGGESSTRISSVAQAMNSDGLPPGLAGTTVPDRRLTWSQSTDAMERVLGLASEDFAYRAIVDDLTQARMG